LAEIGGDELAARECVAAEILPCQIAQGEYCVVKARALEYDAAQVHLMEEHLAQKCHRKVRALNGNLIKKAAFNLRVIEASLAQFTFQKIELTHMRSAHA